MRCRASLGLLLSTLCIGKGALVLSDAKEDASTVSLNDRVAMPLIGMGVGNLAPQHIEEAIVLGVRNHSIRVIDTAHQSANEALVAGAIRKAQGEAGDASAAVDVVTKIWYTYLGTNRTRMSVKSSLEELGLKEAASIVDAEMNGKTKSANKPNGKDKLRVTMLIHWPRCYAEIPWMRCEEEEAELPAEARLAGPPPHLRQKESWRESWRVLESLYKKGALASIGISNFDLEELKELMGMAEVKPHLLQMSLHQYLTDKAFTRYVTEQRLPVQVFSAMFGVLNPEKIAHAAAARGILERIGQERLGGADIAAVLMKWLAQKKVLQIPRASSALRMTANAPERILQLPRLDEEAMTAVEAAVSEIIQTRPPPPPPKPEARQEAPRPPPQGVGARFQNSLDRTLALFWINSADGQELPLHELPPGTHLDEVSHPGHSFVARFTDRREGDKEFRFDIPKDAKPGMQHTFNVHREL